MEKLIDSLVDESITSDEIPIVQSVQKEFSQTKRVRLHQQEAVSNVIQQQSKRYINFFTIFKKYLIFV